MKKLLFMIFGILGILIIGSSVALNMTQIIRTNIILGKIVINEFVVDPQTDWSNNGFITDGTDEWVELYNHGPGNVNITGWNLSLIDTDTNIKILSGFIPAGEYLVIQDPAGSQLDNGRIILYDNYGNLIDSVSYGNYNDGNVGDNAPDGKSNDTDNECLARFPNGMNNNTDKNSFIKQKCTYGFHNEAKEVFIKNKKFVPVDCIFKTNNVTLYVNITTKGCIDNVTFYIFNSIRNYSGVGSPTNNFLGNYFYTISSSLLGSFGNNKYLNWTVIVKDCYNHTTRNGIEGFYVRDNTEISVNPSVPNGLNGWYVTEPLFTLLGDSSTKNIYYQWDASTIFLYTVPFRLENISNPSNVTAGKLKLNWWSEFVCGNETKQNQTFKIDLTNPLVINLTPKNKEIISNKKPEIGAYLDDIYNSNSGINKNLVVMRLDGSFVNVSVFDADTVDALLRYNPSDDLSEGIHEVSVYVEDNAGRKTTLNWSFAINTSIAIFDLNVTSPIRDSYGTKKVKFEITTSKEVDTIEYINHNDKNPRWIKLCDNCNKYGVNRINKKNMNEGENNLVFKATDDFGNLKEFNVSLFVDSKEPEIYKVLPEKESYTNGTDFYLDYIEENLQRILVSWGNFSKVRSLELVNCNESSNKSPHNKKCYFNLNLTEFNGQKIEFSINISDPIRIIESDKIKVEVDTAIPVINNIIYKKNGDEVYFIINITENNLDEIIYSYEEGWETKKKRLCSKLNGGICEKKVIFKNGEHDVNIIVRDKAENFASQSVSFFIDSKIPKIKKLYSENAFANGSFSVEFIEKIPISAVLHYGVEKNMRKEDINLENCLVNSDKYYCKVIIDLSQFNNQEISYYFEIIDISGNTATSKPTLIHVDTSSPLLLNPSSFWQQGTGKNNKYIYFDLEIDEPNLQEVDYIDNSEAKPKYKRLCSKLKNKRCNVKKSFKKGEHDVNVRIIDKAGNSATQTTEFII